MYQLESCWTGGFSAATTCKQGWSASGPLCTAATPPSPLVTPAFPPERRGGLTCRCERPQHRPSAAETWGWRPHTAKCSQSSVPEVFHVLVLLYFVLYILLQVQLVKIWLVGIEIISDNHYEPLEYKRHLSHCRNFIPEPETFSGTFPTKGTRI